MASVDWEPHTVTGALMFHWVFTWTRSAAIGWPYLTCVNFLIVLRWKVWIHYVGECREVWIQRGVNTESCEYREGSSMQDVEENQIQTIRATSFALKLL